MVSKISTNLPPMSVEDVCAWCEFLSCHDTVHSGYFRLFATHNKMIYSVQKSEENLCTFSQMRMSRNCDFIGNSFVPN